MSTLSTATLSSPIGTIRIKATEKGLKELSIVNKKGDQIKPHTALLKEIVSQLKEYFVGSRRSFELPLDADGTDFQKAVWKATSKVPYGKTVQYQDIAKKIGKPLAVRAVGTALGKNPLCIIVPCHRILPKSGGIGQYAYGSKTKQWLLDHEAQKVSKV